MIVSNKHNGNMKLRKNVLNFCSTNKINYNNLIVPSQVHGKNIKIVTEKEKGLIIPNTDGLITKSSNIFLGVFIADCIPVSFYSKKMCGILHVGWRGLSKNIIEEALSLVLNLKEDPVKLCFTIGPGIGTCHFKIGEDVVNSFTHIKINNFLTTKNDDIFLDMKKIIKFILISNNIKKIREINECTFCNKKYFSFRRKKSKKRMIAITSIN